MKNSICRLFVLIGMLVIAGCSHQSMYNAVQESERRDCSYLPESQYHHCLDETNQTYNEYERKVRALRAESD